MGYLLIALAALALGPVILNGRRQRHALAAVAVAGTLLGVALTVGLGWNHDHELDHGPT